MSRWLRWFNNGKQGIKLLDTLQRACMGRLGYSTGQLRKERNQPNEHEQPSQSCESVKCDCDPGSNATCTCTRTTSGTTACGSASRSSAHTSFPCTHCRDHDASSTSGLVRKHKYIVLNGNNDTKYTSTSDVVERDYTDYIAATSAEGQGDSARVRGSDEPRNFKQADANAADSVERRTGIPTGVTI